MDVTKPLPLARPRSSSKSSESLKSANSQPVSFARANSRENASLPCLSPRSPSSVIFTRARSNSRENSSLPCLSPPRSPSPPPFKNSGPLRMSSSILNPSPRFSSSNSGGSLPGILSISKMSKDLGLSPSAANIEKELLLLLNSMDRTGDKMVDIEDLQDSLQSVGLHPMLVDSAVKIIDSDEDGVIGFEEILQLRNRTNRWIFRALIGDLAIRDILSFSSVLDKCFDDANIETEGACLAKCNAGMPKEKASQLFGAAFCSVDGQYWWRGEAHEKFTLQEASAPIMYCKALELVGDERVHSIVGREPRGQGTSEYAMDKFGKPHNPLISLGAIATASMVYPEKDLAERFQEMTAVWDDLTAGYDGTVTFDNFNYLKSSESAVKEFSLAYGAKEKSTFPGVDSHDALTSLLRFHFMCEAIEVNCAQLSIVAATLARGGINPISRKRVFASETAEHCLSVLFACGLKELTGAFAFEIGLPSKSGSSGVMMVVIPGVGGFSFFSPLVSKGDEISMKGVTFCNELLSHLPLHIFDSDSTKLDQMSSEYAAADVYQLIYATANGDLATVKKLVSQRGLDVNSSDYDERTALHLAVAEKRVQVAKFLLEQGAFVRAADRWGRTPLDEASGTELEELLKSFDIQIGL